MLSCTSSSFNNDDYDLDLSSCSAYTQKEFVHKALQDRYYWYQEIPDTVDYDNFASSSAVLEHLKYQPYDRFSYIASSASFDSYYNEGQYIGFGFGYDPKTAYLRFVYSDSPFGHAGFQRGDKIISVDGELTSGIISNDTWSNTFGDASIGVSRTFVIEHQDINSPNTTVTLNKEVVTINTVLAAKTFSQNNHNYAYLAFKNFISPSYAELNTAFSQFKTDNSDKLILDLRYNGGGSIAVASTLASYIYKSNNTVDTFTRLKFNDKYSSENYSFFFNNLEHSLNLDEVIILTTDATCSASEMIINALDPFIDVTVIGSTTCGKPIGMRSQSFCDNELVAINFQGFNHDNFGDYFDGLPANCAAQDDVNYSFGDFDEPMLKAALDFDQQAICSTPSAKQKTNTPRVPFYTGLQNEYASE